MLILKYYIQFQTNLIYTFLNTISYILNIYLYIMMFNSSIWRNIIFIYYIKTLMYICIC